MDDRISFLKLMCVRKLQDLIVKVEQDIDDFFKKYDCMKKLNFDDLYSILMAVNYTADSYDEMRSCKKCIRNLFIM